MIRAAALAALALAAAACDPPTAGPRFRAAGARAPRNGGQLRYSLIDAIRTLDPTLGADEFSYEALHPLFDTLVDFGPPGPHAFDLVPRLAERWTLSSDGRTYVFTLRPGITYADGAPITAADFKFSLERELVTPGSLFGQYLTDIIGASDIVAHAAEPATQDRITADPAAVSPCAGIVATTDRTLTIQLTQANPAFLAILAMPWATPQRAAHVRAAGADLRRRPDATGPFELARWDEGHELVLRRNPHYFDPARAHVDELVIREDVPRDSEYMLFERGELDTAERLAAPDLVAVLGAPAWQPYVHRLAGLNAFGSRMSLKDPILADRRVRQALNYALDKGHTARLLTGTSVPAHGVLPPGMLGRDPDLAPYPHDVGKARALLAEAGHPDGLDLEYVYAADDETALVASSLQSDLAAAGVRVTLVPMAFTTFGDAIGEPTGPAFSYIGTTADFADPIAFFEANFHGKAIADHGSSNNTFYANPALDQLLDAAHGELDPERRAVLYRQAERILFDDPPWLWDYHRVITEVSQPYVRGYDLHPIWLRDFTSAWLDLGPDGQPEPR